METWLVTGGAGFIGSAFLRLLRARRPQLRLVNLDLLSYAADLRRLKDLQEGAGYRFVQGDVCDRRLLDALFAQEDIVHSYPHCWRCKGPIIFRATPQWFCSVESFKEQAVAACDDVRWVPGWGLSLIHI